MAAPFYCRTTFKEFPDESIPDFMRRAGAHCGRFAGRVHQARSDRHAHQFLQLVDHDDQAGSSRDTSTSSSTSGTPGSSGSGSTSAMGGASSGSTTQQQQQLPPGSTSAIRRRHHAGLHQQQRHSGSSSTDGRPGFDERQQLHGQRPSTSPPAPQRQTTRSDMQAPALVLMALLSLGLAGCNRPVEGNSMRPAGRPRAPARGGCASAPDTPPGGPAGVKGSCRTRIRRAVL